MFYIFKNRRLVYKEAPEAKSIDEVGFQAATAPEREKALSLDDVDAPEEAGADHSVVQDYMENVVDPKLEETRKDIPAEAEAQTQYDEADAALNAAAAAEDALAGDHHPAGKLSADEAQALAVKLAGVPSIAAACVEGVTLTDIAAKVDAEVQARQSEKELAEKQLEASKTTDSAQEKVRGTLESLAIDTLKEKQRQRFEAEKSAWAVAKAAEVIGTLGEIDDAPQRVTLAKTFIEGLLSNAEFTYDPSKFDLVFANCYERTKDASVLQFVNNLMPGGEEENADVIDGWKKTLGEDYKDVDPAVRAYIHGLLASHRGTDQEANHEMIMGRLDALDKPLTLENVQAALKDYHDVLDVPAAEFRADDLPKDDYDKFSDLRDKNPQIDSFYGSRVAAARKVLGGEEFENYKLYVLQEVARLGSTDMNAINSIASPSLWKYKAESVSKIPETAVAAKGWSPEAQKTAENITKTLTLEGVEPPKVISFVSSDGRVYYANFAGKGQLYLYEVPGGARGAAEKADKKKDEAKDSNEGGGEADGENFIM